MKGSFADLRKGICVRVQYLTALSKTCLLRELHPVHFLPAALEQLSLHVFTVGFLTKAIDDHLRVRRSHDSDVGLRLR